MSLAAKKAQLAASRQQQRTPGLVARWCAASQRSDAKQATGEESGERMSAPARVKAQRPLQRRQSRRPLGWIRPREGH
ncbi:hypothetical protein GQ55_5G158700 [Panicum hallii var. hallii]|uniref:Uncharacterized protein n=1 Tax=Panicum hallii var. hallii TaxID=1504633 RepID=A0A2T7DGS8_9POAL|nr:hypothetical protein GQ55_5G158700 [Panicum hallii var. hallii]